jgi:steroid delta-isomerase-like uncharacterized protein
MASAVEIHRAAHAAFNTRDWDTMRSLTASDISYEDNPRASSIKSYEQFLEFLQEWTSGMSDAAITEQQYLDAGEYSIVRFRGRGTNDGQMGPLQPTGRRMDMPFCEIVHVNSDGKIDRGELYYDQLTMLVQFGVMEQPTA